MTTVSPTQNVAEKAAQLVDDRRVVLWRPGLAVVGGDHDRRLVEATPKGVACSCPAGKNLDPVSCSHKVAAMIVWATEKER